MADNVILNENSTVGATIATDEISGVQHQFVKIEFGVDGVATPVSATDPLPVLASIDTTGLALESKQQIDALTDTQLRATPVPVSGTFFQATQPVSGTVSVDALPAGLAVAANQQTDALTNAELRATPVPISGTVTATSSKPSTGGQSSPSVTNSSTVILASNANRLGATIYNEGAAVCYMKLGATASLTSYSLQIASGGYYEVPFGYTGAIDGITSSGTAQLRVSELT